MHLYFTAKVHKISEMHLEREAHVIKSQSAAQQEVVFFLWRAKRPLIALAKGVTESIDVRRIPNSYV